MKPQKFYNLEQLKDDKEVLQYTSIQLKSFYDILSSGIKFQDNVNCRVISATFTAANTDTVFNHGLGFTPLGYQPIGLTAAMSVYNGTVAFNSTDITLKSSAIGVATLLVF